MRRHIWLFIGAAVIATTSLFGSIFYLQTRSERQALLLYKTTRVTSGELYDTLVRVAESCAEPVPELYVSRAEFYHFNAKYFTGSTFPLHLRAGKIMVSEDLVRFFGHLEMRGLLAHEIAHLKADSGFSSYVNLNSESHVAVDHRAAACVGPEAVHRTLTTLKNMKTQEWADAHRYLLSKGEYQYILDQAKRGYGELEWRIAELEKLLPKH